MDLSMARWRKSSFSGDNGGDCVEIVEFERSWTAPITRRARQIDRRTGLEGPQRS